ncbi:lysylphosphatidylglycerol synthase transmembrane domain-containing protein [Geodermatophilus chilensis]|uniref:lysylphosphatidylglycerol synthase transmembrane domain-containing protein n=1 Tax=Geodermatophilus chilensis TaxID=2035835 RepID=UPI000C26241C|nr:lysylphosphatidylglycerol synthase transmembrane domain-containing protein [Geodermatophilus chilensis]
MTEGGADRRTSFWPRTRVRRPADGVELALAAGALLLLVLFALLAPDVPTPGTDLADAVLGGLPRTLLSIANGVASLAVLGVLGAVLLDAFRWRRFAVTSAGLACVLAVGAGEAAEWLLGRQDLLGPAEDAAVTPIAAAVGLLLGADLQRRPRWTTPARLAVGAALLCALGLGSLTLLSGAIAVLAGLTAGLLVRVVVGVVPARPDEGRIRAVLAAAGLPVDELRALPHPAESLRYAATSPGGDLEVTVVDPDRRGVSLARRGVSLVRLRSSVVGRPALTLRGQLEREALCAGIARGADVPAPWVVTLLSAGPALLSVARPLAGTPLGNADGEVPGELRAAFAALRRVHRAGVAHGALSPRSVVLLPDGRVGFSRWRSAQPAASELQRELDLVALLVTAAAHAGVEPAVAALRAGYGTEPAAEARLAALAQPLVLPPPLREAVRRTGVVGDLRTALAGPSGPAPATAPRLERVRPRTLLTVLAATVAAYVLASQLSEVSLVGTLSAARWEWFAVAVLGSAVTYVGAALALQAFVPVGLPLGRTTLVQVATAFVTLVTPPTVGHVGLGIRYLQRSGVPLSTAAASVAVSQVVTVVVTVVVLLVCSWVSGVSASRPTLLPSGEVLVVLLVATAVLVAVGLLPPTRRLLHRRVEPLLRQTLPQLLSALTQPRRVGTAVLGILLLNGGYVLALDASLRAFSASLSLPTLVVVYLAASTIGSAAPTPGGLGAVEAALVGALTATGVPVTAALTAVLAFRTATFWLPAPFGWLAFLALQRKQRI